MHYPESIQVLSEALQNQTEDVQTEAVIQLGYLRNQSTIPYLLSAIETGSWNVRAAAFESLVKIGAPAVGHLKQISNHKDENVRHRGVVSIGRIGTRDCIEFLLILLKSKNKESRENAFQALKFINMSQLDLILVNLSDDDIDFRKHIINIISS